MLRRGVLAYPQVAEEALEPVGLAHVIVLPQHVHQQRLAEAARPDEEEKLVGRLNLRYEAGLVYVVTIFEAHVLPVLHAVRYAFRLLLRCLLLFHHCTLSWFCQQR